MSGAEQKADLVRDEPNSRMKPEAEMQGPNAFGGYPTKADKAGFDRVGPGGRIPAGPHAQMHRDRQRDRNAGIRRLFSGLAETAQESGRFGNHPALVQSIQTILSRRSHRLRKLKIVEVALGTSA